MFLYHADCMSETNDTVKESAQVDESSVYSFDPCLIILISVGVLTV